MLQQCFTMYTITRDSIPKQTAKLRLEVFNFRSTVLQIGEYLHAALKQTTEVYFLCNGSIIILFIALIAR
mgnify:CR=1 FL=1